LMGRQLNMMLGHSRLFCDALIRAIPPYNETRST
jgi:hypothetical protein